MCNMTFEETSGENSSERSACVCAFLHFSAVFDFIFLFYINLTTINDASVRTVCASVNVN